MTGSRGEEPAFRHTMPFGTELEGDGVRVRLWAPAVEGVEVVLGGEGKDGSTPMHPVRGEDVAFTGWHTLHLPGLPPGFLYRFRVDGEEPVPDPASRF